jgi:CheY-like chemotaxis protein
MNAQRKVLVVDDDPVVGTSFNRVLSGKGYIVVSAENGFDALNRLKDEQFDMVFTDLRMPGMDGIEVAENVRANQPWLPVVIVTGYGSADNETRARAAGVSDFLRKPLSPEMIERSAARALATAPAEAAGAVTIEALTAPSATAANQPLEAVAPVASVEPGRGSVLKNMLLFLSAPFVGLLYILLLPLVGVGTALWTAARWLAQPTVLPRTKRVLQRAAAPLVGLAYVIVLPFAGLAMLAWTAIRAVARRAPAE